MSKTSIKKPGELEDNFDDFDDVLEEFSAKPPSAPPPSAALPQTRPRTNTRVDRPPPSIPGAAKLWRADEDNEDELSNDFVRELAKGMENLMKELGNTEGAQSSDDTEAGRERALQAAWEAMLVEGLNGETTASDVGSEYKGAKDFQSTIQETMRKLKENDPATGTDPEMQQLEDLLKDLGMGEGEGTDEEIAGMLEKMMGQLMNKDILYEPLKELHDKFPDFMAANTATLSPEDKTRYTAQQACVEKIVKAFESPSYSDDNAQEVKKMVDLLSEMQSYGSPPESIIGPLPPGLGFGADGMPQLPGECALM